MQLGRLWILPKCNIVGLDRAAQKDNRIAGALRIENALHEVETKNFGKQLLHSGNIWAVQQYVIQTARGHTALLARTPGRRIDQATAIADGGLLGVKLNQVATGYLETHALTRFSNVALSSTLYPAKSSPARSA